jgi:NAD(P)-dependent dehydrogenase (short-subunit alcohol dehydrogenase family)
MPVVLVTGAARGIGRTITEHLARRGWDVIAGVRSATDAASVNAANPGRITPVILDVTDAGHVARLDSELPARLDGVVNNAGIAVIGSMETVTSESWRRQFEVNVIGQMAVTRAVLPRLRDSGGRIVFIASVNGRLAMPMMGAYCASKFALEAAAAAIRMELRPWRIPVSLVEPAQTDTDMVRTADAMVDQMEAGLDARQRALYARHINGFKKRIPVAWRTAAAPETVALVVERALTARRPRARYVVGAAPRLVAALTESLPIPVRDRVLRRVTGQP